MSQRTGFKSTDHDNDGRVQPATLNPVQFKRAAGDSISWVAALVVTSGTLSAASTLQTVGISGIEAVARVGDLLLINSQELSVVGVFANQIVVGQRLLFPAPIGTTYELRRYASLRTLPDGTLLTDIAKLPAQESGRVPVMARFPIPTTASTPVSVAYNAATLVTALAANTARARFYVRNASTNVTCALRLGSATTDPLVNAIPLAPGDSYASDLYEWSGDIQVIGLNGAGSVNVQELS